MKAIILFLTIGMLLTACSPCELTATDSVTVYERPSAAAGVFGTLGAGESVRPEVKTADGFYGFDPGVAQAGNVGIFRNRWVLKNYQVDLTGNCTMIATAVGPITNLCYAMLMVEMPVYTSADTASDLITTLQPGDYAQVVGASPGWVQVDMNVGSMSIDSLGWVQDTGIGYNGSCEGG